MLLSLLGSVFWMIVTLGLLITFHEFGHFWVARRCGVKVERFSIGFGKALWKHTARDGTQYQVAAIPLGGYVKMADARNTAVPKAERDAAFWASEFTRKPVWKRLLIVAAGPSFNVIFALVAFWVMFMLGAQAIAPLVNPTPQGMAAMAGVRSGDRLVAVNGDAVSSYDQGMEAVASSAMVRQPASLQVKGTDGALRTVTLPLDQLATGQDLGQDLEQLGIKPMPAPAIAAAVMPGMPAAASGMKDGDRILRINGEPVKDFEKFHDQLAAAALISPTVHLDVQRGATLLHLSPVARKQSLEGQKVSWMIGIQSGGPAMVIQRFGVFRAMREAGRATWQSTTQSLTMVKQLVTGQSSAKNVSGVIGIAQVANTSAGMGLSFFLKFLALVSLSLAIVNLLPIPILDGGHLLFYLIEAVKGSPVSDRVWQVGQALGVGLLCGLMALAFFNDIHRLIAS